MGWKEIVPDIRKDYIVRQLKNGKRSDGRALDEIRPISFQFNVAGSAEGSARIKRGGSEVIAGIKLGLATPYPDSPNSGVLTTNFELAPMASPVFETGPPREVAIELARVTDRAIREAKVVDMEKMCITPGEQVWMIFIDIHPLDYMGNLFDCAELAALSALMCTTIPAKDKGIGEENFKLPVNCYPISCTSVKIGDTILIDPDLDEEQIADARITVATDENGAIRAMQMGGSGSFTVDEVKKIIKASTIMGAKIREQLFAAAKEAGVGGPN
ncbi:MAG: exosome complex protein Rrp42 [Thermoplasmata archaeon]|nr:exosome complex protein Rrp42 [Thermoplasmata archaeon]